MALPAWGNGEKIALRGGENVTAEAERWERFCGNGGKSKRERYGNGPVIKNPRKSSGGDSP